MKPTVYVVWSGAIHPATIVRGIANNRGVTVKYAVELRTADKPMFMVEVPKSDVFKDEEVAKKTFFVRKLKDQNAGTIPRAPFTSWGGLLKQHLKLK